MLGEALGHLGAPDLGEVEPAGQVGEGLLLLPHGAGDGGRHLLIHTALLAPKFPSYSGLTLDCVNLSECAALRPRYCLSVLRLSELKRATMQARRGVAFRSRRAGGQCESSQALKYPETNEHLCQKM